LEYVSKIIYKNKTIYCVDYSIFQKDNDKKEKTLQLLKMTAHSCLKQPENSVLALINVTNFYFDMDILNAFKESSNLIIPFEKKLAIIGVKGIIKTAYNFVIGATQDSKAKSFDSKEEAKEWLVKDESLQN
jgi:hypothetical protein